MTAHVPGSMRDWLRWSLSRRGVLKAGAAAGVTLGLGSLLAACGDDDDDSSSGGSGSATATKSGTAASPTTGSSGTTSQVDFSKAKPGGKLSMSLADSDATSF